jgi:hypothetical protein
MQYFCYATAVTPTLSRAAGEGANGGVRSYHWVGINLWCDRIAPYCFMVRQAHHERGLRILTLTLTPTLPRAAGEGANGGVRSHYRVGINLRCDGIAPCERTRKLRVPP